MVPPVSRTIIRISSKSRLASVSLQQAPGALSLASSHAYATTSTSQHTSSHSSPSKSGFNPKKDGFSQGNANDPQNLHKKDVQSEAVRGGKEAKKGGEGIKGKEAGNPLDAASGERVKKADADKGKGSKGNPEGVGMADQVGSASATSEAFDKRK